MQNLRIGSIVTLVIGMSQTSDLTSMSDAVVRNITDAYIEVSNAGNTDRRAVPWHRVIALTITTP